MLNVNYLRSTNTKTQAKLNAAAHLKSQKTSVLTLNAFAVRVFLEGLDYSDLEYRDCMELLQELLRLPQSAGIPLARRGDSVDEKGHTEDFSTFVVEQMIKAGYSKETAWKCRNSAAAKAAGGVRLKSSKLLDAYNKARLTLGDRSWDYETAVETKSEDLAALMATCE